MASLAKVCLLSEGLPGLDPEVSENGGFDKKGPRLYRVDHCLEEAMALVWEATFWASAG